MTRAELLELMRVTRAKLEDLIAGLTQDRMTQRGVAGEWSVKDMLAHIAWYQREEADFYGETGEPASPLWDVPQDPRNELLFEQSRGRTLDDVLSDFRQSFDKFVAVVERISDEDLNLAGRFPGTSAERLPWQAIAAHAHEHDREHIDMIRGWCASLP